MAHSGWYLDHSQGRVRPMRGSTQWRCDVCKAVACLPVAAFSRGIPPKCACGALLQPSKQAMTRQFRKLPEAPKASSAVRRCRRCRKVLSSYNHGRLCYACQLS